MGIEHRESKESDVEVMRCPSCGYISTVKVEDDQPYVSLQGGATGPYFVCQNFKCSVERIYSDNAVMVGGK